MPDAVENETLVHVFRHTAQAARFVSHLWLALSRKALFGQATFTVALSGGKTPSVLYDTLSRSKGAFPWSRTHLFLVDERFVPSDDPESIAGLIRKHLLDPLSLPGENLHAVPTEGVSLEEAARHYEDALRTFFGARCMVPCFDLVMLGIGRDGHTASLFPDAAGLEEGRRLAIPVRTGHSPHERITLTFTVINSASNVVFFVTGRDKAAIMRQVLDKKGDAMLPAARVRPLNKRLLYVLDEGAASRLDRHSLRDHVAIVVHP